VVTERRQWTASAMPRSTTKITAPHMDPGTPWQNGFVESFKGHLRDQLLTLVVFDSMWEIRTVLGRSPAHAGRVCAAVTGTEQDPKCSQEVDR